MLITLIGHISYQTNILKNSYISLTATNANLKYLYRVRYYSD